jgi:glycosyltransferase involved in cell wall biosynthesis
MTEVLVDMTALDTPSRHRGIGRYVAGLCGALARVARPQGLVVAGLVRHKGAVRGAVDPTLGYGGDPELVVAGAQYSRYKMERRLFLGGLARRTGTDLLHLPDPYGTPIDMRVPRIATCHDLIPLLLHREYFGFPGARALQWLRDSLRYRTVRRVIAVSAATKRDLVEHVGVAPEDVDVVHHGVDHQRYNRVEDPDEGQRVGELLGFRAPYLLYVGAGDARKNLPRLIEAYGQSGLQRELPLVLVGSLSTRQRARVQRAVAKHGVGASVHLRGHVDEALIPALYRQCLAHVFPSRYEGFGLPLLEAMACGAATVTSSVSSLGEVAGDAALVVDTSDPEALAEALVRVAEDGALRATLSARGVARAADFTWERCAEQTLQCYLRALERS